MQKPELLRIKSYLDAIVGERNPFSAPDQLKRYGDYIADQFRRFQLTVSREPVPLTAIFSFFMINIMVQLKIYIFNDFILKKM